jgi:hypothetical protein
LYKSVIPEGGSDMRTWRIATATAVVVALCALAALAVQQPAQPDRGRPVYKVVPWPVNTDDRPYRDDVERLLNQMAAQGWTLHGDLAAQGAKMLVFERTPTG